MIRIYVHTFFLPFQVLQELCWWVLVTMRVQSATRMKKKSSAEEVRIQNYLFLRQHKSQGGNVEQGRSVSYLHTPYCGESVSHSVNTISMYLPASESEGGFFVV